MSHFEYDLLGDFQEEEPQDIPSSDKYSTILDDPHEEETEILVISQSNSDLLDEPHLFRAVNRSQGDNAPIRNWNIVTYQEEVSYRVHSDPESQHRTRKP